MSETLHGTVVLVGAHGVLIRGAPAAGKSLLALALIDRGARLVADDRVHVSACGGRLVASAPAAIAGLIELRGRGIVKVPHERSAVIRLVVDVVGEEALDRMPEDDQMTVALLGIPLPRQPVPDEPRRAVLLVDAAIRALFPPGNITLRSPGVWG